MSNSKFLEGNKVFMVNTDLHKNLKTVGSIITIEEHTTDIYAEKQLSWDAMDV